MSEISGFALFCEDIRDESQGTDTLVGVLAGGISVSNLPFQIHKLGIYVRVQVLGDWAEGPVKCSLVLPNNEEVQIGLITEDEFEQHAALPELKRGSLGVIMTVVKTVDISKEGPLVVELRYKDKTIPIGRLDVLLRENVPA